MRYIILNLMLRKSLKLNIVTPCSRPKNLQLLLDSIRIANNLNLFEIKWYIVFDAETIPESQNLNPQDYPSGLKIQLNCYKNSESISGNGQRNFALEQITDGFVYFLDDDNLMHPDLLTTIWNQIQLRGEEIGIVGNQLFSEEIIRSAARHLVKPGSIDIAQLCIHKNLIGNKKWPLAFYDADGKFISNIYTLHYQKFVFVEKVIAYYNKLTKKPR